ncbi:hypothetical protein B0H13DRAFT_1878700 [Mycena leptocephala]|nr:hypothetical protein B0H13DRAFT_1878700 [Mycena leptocephala]
MRRLPVPPPREDDGQTYKASASLACEGRTASSAHASQRTSTNEGGSSAVDLREDFRQDARDCARRVQKEVMEERTTKAKLQYSLTGLENVENATYQHSATNLVAVKVQEGFVIRGSPGPAEFEPLEPQPRRSTHQVLKRSKADESDCRLTTRVRHFRVHLNFQVYIWFGCHLFGARCGLMVLVRFEALLYHVIEDFFCSEVPIRGRGLERAGRRTGRGGFQFTEKSHLKGREARGVPRALFASRRSYLPKLLVQLEALP